jgi:hypothetical protein
MEPGDRIDRENTQMMALAVGIVMAIFVSGFMAGWLVFG